MRYFTGWLSAVALVWALPATAAEPLELDHVQQGILPNGGYYNVYTFNCSTDREYAVVRLRQSHWCSRLDSGVYCRRKPSSVVKQACVLDPAGRLVGR